MTTAIMTTCCVPLCSKEMRQRNISNMMDRQSIESGYPEDAEVKRQLRIKSVSSAFCFQLLEYVLALGLHKLNLQCLYVTISCRNVIQPRVAAM